MKVNLGFVKDRNFIIASVTTLLFLMIGLVLFFSDFQYYEKGQFTYLIIFMMGLLVFFFSAFRMMIPLILLGVLIMCSALFVSSLKYDWRKDYIENSRSGLPFAAEAYVDKYPTFEQQLKIEHMDQGSDWVNFAKDCIDVNVVEKEDINPRCSSLNAISTNYRIDALSVLKEQFKKMRDTAKMVEENKFKNRARYITCVNSKQCAVIPMLPGNIKSEDIDPRSYQYIDIRRAFWQLVDELPVDPALCSFDKMCKALLAHGALTEETLKQL